MIKRWKIAIGIFLVLELLNMSVSFERGNNPNEFGDSTSSDSGNVPPVVEVIPDVSSGKAPLTVHFEGEAYDEDGEIFLLEWDFEGDGVFEAAQNVKGLNGSLRVVAVKNALQKGYTYTMPGIFHALLRVTDDKGDCAVSSVTVQVYSDVPRLDVVSCNKKEFTYMAQAGYEAFFAGIENVQFQIGDAWISYQLHDQHFGEITNVKGIPEENMIRYNNVYPGIDVRYTVYEDLLLEEFIVLQPMDVSVIEHSFQLHGIEYQMHEDGSIGFYNGEDLIFSIPQPVMYELENPEKKCYGLHYEIVEQGDYYLLKKVIDDQEWLKTAQYPVVIDSSTQGEIADPWEQQGLTPYGQYFKNLNEYVDPLTGHLTICNTDYSLSGRGLDVAVTRVYSTVVAYKQGEDGPGEFVPIATYKMAPTDLGCGWSLDFPWLEIDDEQPGKYFHMRDGKQVRTQFQNGVWLCDEYGFTMYINGDNTYTKYRDNGIKEEYDNMGRITSITDLNQNQLTFSYYPYGIASITDTVGRIITFSYSGNKLTSISDGTRTINYNYSGDKLVSVTGPLGRVTSYEYLSENSFLITGIHYPSGGFSSYEYTAVVPSFAKVAPYKSLETNNGETDYYVYKVDSSDTVSWTSPKDLNTVTASAGRPCVFQRDDGSLVMYFKDKYMWTEENCYWDHDQWVCETITHAEWWFKRSVSTDQNHWSTPQNVVQVKNTTGNPIVIEKQDGSFVMYYKDKYVWTEENCYWEGCPWDCQFICETETHTDYWIYRRTSSDGLIWGSPVKVQKTTLGVRNITAIQKQDATFLMCYTDKVGSSYYIRQKTSSNGTNWSSPSNVVLVNSSTGNAALLQRDTGTVYLAYRKGASIYVLSNTGNGWSSPLQTTAVSDGDPALLQTETDVVIIYKGTDDKCYRISSSDGTTWSSPSQIAPHKAISDPATVDRKDRFYRVTAQYISASTIDLVKVTEYSYEGDGYIAKSTDVLIRDAQTLRSSMHFEYDSKGRTVKRISKDEQGVQTEKICYTYNNADKVISQDVYAGTSTAISYSVMTGYDNWGNIIYTRDPEGAEHFYSYANTNGENQFVDSKGVPISLFSNTFYTNSIPPNCHTFIVGEAFINNGKVQETYYKYDTNGNLTETKTLFPTHDYAVFSGTFDENGQTTFDIDLTGLTITDGILVISSIPVPTVETLHETHSEAGKGWLNTGTWSGKYFIADYYKCYNFEECFDGQTRIGPFNHYPGTPDCTECTTWVEDNTQYVKTNYTAAVNEYPEKVDYNLNNSSWTTITNNVGSGTTSTTVPASSFVQGSNTLQFRESNAYSTKFSWTFYMDQGTVPEEYTTTYSYNNYGNVISTTDGLSNTTYFGYDPNYVYLLSITNSLNQTVTATYDFSTGLLTSKTDANGNTTSFEYDSLGRITKKIYPDLSELEAVYDDKNNCITIYDELDHKTIHYYDGIGRIIKTEKYLSLTNNYVETYTYNYLNKMKTHIDFGGHTSSYEYDSRGRPTKISNPDFTFRKIQYDDVSNTTIVYDENLHRTEYHCDWSDRLLWVKEYTDSVNYYLTQYTYDDLGNVTSITDAHGNTTFYDYSFFGITKITYPGSTTEIFSYDSVGNLLQIIDANGTTIFNYDSIYQLTEIVYPDQSSVSFEYDFNGNRTLVTDPHGQTSYTYDSRNRCISETRTIEGILYAVNYAYDAASRLVSMVYPDQSVIPFEYDSLNRLTTIPGHAEVTYTADSLCESMAYGNDTVTLYQYDNRDRPISMHTRRNDTDLLVVGYQYDPVGNITQLHYDRKLNQQWIQSEEAFGYDWLDRLVSVQGEYGLVTYSYDPVGNRLSQNDALYTYNTENELLSINDGTAFTYDGKGNTTTKTDSTNTWAYTYDAKNQLIQIEKNQQVIAQYEYDGDGKRIKKTEWIESLQEYQDMIYVYSGPNVIYEKNVTTDTCATYVYGTSGKIAKKVNGFIGYYHADRLGSTRLITDESGNVVTNVNYTPFGECALDGEKERYLYTGKEKDGAGLYYFGARYYNSEVGRFMTRDRFKGDYKNPQSLNLYTYCLNNPIRYVDPFGFEEENPEDVVRKIFEHLLNMDVEELGVDLDDLLKEVNNSMLSFLEKLGGFLKGMGFEVTVAMSHLEVIYESGEPPAIIEIHQSLPDALGQVESTGKISIGLSGHKTVADLLTTILHELSHRALTRQKLTRYEEESLVYKIQKEYMGKVKDLAKAEGQKNTYSLGYRMIITVNSWWYALGDKLGL